jgi:transcriptional regulator with XRE-family HTH domain
MAQNTHLMNLRIRAGMSQSEASRRSGMNQATISLVEAGRSIPNSANLASLLDVYGQTELAASIRQYLPTR